MTPKEMSILALLAQKKKEVIADIEELGLGEEAERYAEILISDETEDEPDVVRDLRFWARQNRRLYDRMRH